ncbi:putative late blight resistance protein homolog R1B-13 [Capsicum annuum]|uniref:putative late blight resistance protein homolog R1B-13 n=1 Tax=Capsicum annuum TaxID=4072 RepID=UPI001FB14E01|nr:putative late blight resistance protein homolog R1B-13 [Capsicum annuum]
MEHGREWNMGEEDTFENLKYLCLEEVTLAKWEFGEESFPVLEKLALWRCSKLTEIPPNFGDGALNLKIQLWRLNNMLKISREKTSFRSLARIISHYLRQILRT